MESSEEAVSGSDIVICIAAVLDPVLHGEWLSPGATVIGAGPTTWRAREVDDATFARAAKIFVDSPEQAPIEVGDMAGAVDRGILQWSQLQELRHVVAGTVKGRDSADQINLRQADGHRRRRRSRRQAGPRQRQSQRFGDGNGVVGGQFIHE